MITEDNKRIVISSLIWKLMERIGSQGIQFIVQIILARLLLPEDFGLIAIVIVFTTFAQVFIQKGFNTALIQKKDADDLDFSSIFFLSIIISILIYFILFFTAPYIANFYGISKLTSLIRVLSIILLFGSIYSVQMAYVARYMLFKVLFRSSVVSILVSGTIGILLAYLDFGVWALVIQQIINQLIITVILWFTIDWRPSFIFSLKRTKELFSFGWKLLVSSLLNTLYLDIRTLIIGRIYTPSLLGIYNRGEQFPKIIVTNVDGSIQSVMLPTLSSHQDDVIKMKTIVRRAIKSSTFLIMPAMVLLFIVSEPLIIIVLTDKWLASAPFLQLFAIAYAFIPISTTNAQAINALGKSDIFLKLEIVKKIIGLTLLGISIQFGIFWIAFSMVLTNILSTAINAYPNKHLLNYGYLSQLIDILPIILVSATTGMMIFPLRYIIFHPFYLLISQTMLGIIIYLLSSKLFRLDGYTYLFNTIKDLYYKRESSK